MNKKIRRSMSLQKLIKDLKDRANNAHAKQVDIYIEPDELLKLCEAAEYLLNRMDSIGHREEPHECDSSQAYGYLLACEHIIEECQTHKAKADSICGGENGKG